MKTGTRRALMVLLALTLCGLLPDWFGFVDKENLRWVVCVLIAIGIVMTTCWQEAVDRVAEADKSVEALQASLSQSTANLASLQGDSGALLPLQASQQWRHTPADATPLIATRAYRDAYSDLIHGGIRLRDRAAMLMKLPMVQRLDSVCQLPFARFEHPCASHTRLQHSLGVAHLAGKAMAHLLASKSLIQDDGSATYPNITTDERDELIEVAEVSGLLHDLGHGPFAHATDRLVRAFVPGLSGKPDVFLGVSRIRSIPDDYLAPEWRDRIERILSPIRGDIVGYDKVIADLIDGDVDVDRLDYLMRDATLACVPDGRVDFRELFESFRIDMRRSPGFHLVIDSRATASVGHFLYARHVMYRRVYDGSIKMLCERLLTRALHRLVEEASTRAVDNPRTEDDFRLLLEGILLMTDEQMLSYLWSRSGDRRVMKGLLSNLRYPPKYRTVAVLELEELPTDFRKLMFGAARTAADDRSFLRRTEEMEEKAGELVGIQREDSWQIVFGLPTLDSTDTIDLHMAHFDDKTRRYESARPLAEFLELLARRPYQEPLDAFLRQCGAEGETLQARIRDAIKNPANADNAKILQAAKVFEGAPFLSALIHTRHKVRVYAHMELLQKKTPSEIERAAREAMGARMASA